MVEFRLNVAVSPAFWALIRTWVVMVNGFVRLTNTPVGFAFWLLGAIPVDVRVCGPPAVVPAVLKSAPLFSTHELKMAVSPLVDLAQLAV